MAISIQAMKTALKAAFDAEKDQTDDQEASIDRITTAMAQTIAEQIEQGINTAVIALNLTVDGVPVDGTITITTTAE
jgi:hypothetical protein